MAGKVRTVATDNTGPAFDAEKLGIDQLYEKLESSAQGLTSEEAGHRLEQYGPNALEEKKKSRVMVFLSFFWGPIPWMIEIAALLSLAVRHWDDFIIILVMLLINSVIGFVQESKAADALEALKASMALKARALRDGQWSDVDAKTLVPGDMLELRLGNVIPADVKLVAGEYLSVDQAALTGESLPVSKKPGDIAYSGSAIKQGEMTALVTSTGGDTFFGRTARLVGSAGAVSHFQKAVMKIGDFLIAVAVGLSAVLILVELHRGEPAVTLLQFVLILVIASIPVAMPAVLSVTMALGALALSKKKAIVSRLQAIEEMAGVNILCSDKTGTLTKNQLTLGDPAAFAAKDGQEVILYGSLASKEEDKDAIDLAVIGGLRDHAVLQDYEQEKFTPFDPVSKRTMAVIKDKDGKTFKVAKGAPQVIVGLSNASPEDREKAMKLVDELAAKGNRALGVAYTEGDGADGSWELSGILSLYDPPRDDSKETITHAHEHGIDVKMVTGDDVAIGREIAGQLGMGSNIRPAGELFEGEDPANLPEEKCRIVERADGFGRVFPEHKYGIVKALQKLGHLTAMTGDGVNDAPALKQADVGIAVSGATDAARAAADLVLTAPGLSAIIDAVDEARRIFQRMLSYTIYRIAMTTDIMLFVVLSMILFERYPLTAVMIILLALLNDIPIMSIAYDNTRLSRTPVRWEMGRVLTVSSVLGFLSVIQTFGLLLLGVDYFHLDHGQLQTMVFLQLLSGGALMLMVTRNQHAFWRPPFPALIMLLAISSTQILAIALALYGWLMPALPGKLIAIVWGYNLIWMVFNDLVKLATYRSMDMRERHKQKFLQTANTPLHQFGKTRSGV
ncbi:MAG: plasma-membrane proton-efflux P-type ATPase [Pseudomonadota bacterium]|nr:plasma-membrane proton-efflux P-type ATPase [Pseudomonadota bacterium]